MPLPRVYQKGTFSHPHEIILEFFNSEERLHIVKGNQRSFMGRLIVLSAYIALLAYVFFAPLAKAIMVFIVLGLASIITGAALGQHKNTKRISVRKTAGLALGLFIAIAVLGFVAG